MTAKLNWVAIFLATVKLEYCMNVRANTVMAAVAEKTRNTMGFGGGYQLSKEIRMEIVCHQ